MQTLCLPHEAPSVEPLDRPKKARSDVADVVKEHSRCKMAIRHIGTKENKLVLAIQPNTGSQRHLPRTKLATHAGKHNEEIVLRPST